MNTILFDYPAQRTKHYLLGAGSFSHPVLIQPFLVLAVDHG